jgi:hypothetical protein
LPKQPGKGRPGPVTAKALSDAVRDVFFLVNLVLTINDDLVARTDRLGLQAALSP